MNPAGLFNCRHEYAVPDWPRFCQLELAGCVHDPEVDGSIIGGALASAAIFFTVYGRSPALDGTCEAITDIDDLRKALAVAAELSALSGLSCIISPTLMERSSMMAKYGWTGQPSA